MFHKIKYIKPLPDFRLLADFENGEKREYDISPLFEKWAVFRDLINTPGLFELVKVDVGGYGISWNDCIDLSCDELYCNGTEIL
jgi:hypothetical protein